MSDKGAINLALDIKDENENANIELNQLSKPSEEESEQDFLQNNDNNEDKIEKPTEEIVEEHIIQDDDKNLSNHLTSFVNDGDKSPNHSHRSDVDDSPNLKRWKSGPLDSKDPNLAHNGKNGGVEDEVKYKQPSKLSPFDRAFFVSKYLTFWWMQNLFTLGNKKILGSSDLFEMPSRDHTDKISDKFEREWNKEAYDENGHLKQNASLMKVVFRVFGYQYMLLGIPAMTMECFRLAQPIFLGLITSYFAPKSKVSAKDAYLYGLGLTLCSLIVGWHNICTTFIKQRFGMRTRVALSAMVYKKVLRLSHTALAGTTTGHIVNLVSVDVQKLDFAALFLHFLWIGPILVGVSGYLVWREIGISSLAGIGLLLLLAPLQMMMGRLLMKIRRNVVKYTDKRVKIINEIITGIRVIKMYAWEESFKKVVDELRVKEIRAIRRLSYLRASFLSFFFSSSSLVSFVTFMTYVLTGNALTARKVFTCVSLFNVSRLVMTLFFPLAVTLLNEARVSIERIQSLLLMDELQAPGLEKSNLRPKSSFSSISVENLHASWTQEAKTLEDINLTVGQGELAAIVGPVGCGKSSLLMAIIGELLPEKGSVNTVGKIAYVSQEAWIFNGTLKNNITFGQELNEKRYQKVIQICALEKDIELLPQGDLTLVGERGVSLSGGQKARVNLARAVYFNADIYILDDPLSAVDAHVGRHLFDECISGYLSNKIRVLVTHQLQYLADANQILVLSQGKAIANGTYSYLKSTGINFVNLLQTEDKIENEDLDALDEETRRVRSFSRQLSITDADVKRRNSGRRQRRLSQVSMVDPENIGSDLSIASEVVKVEEFEEKEIPKEKKFEGTVTYKSYLNFFRAGYGLPVWGLLLLLFAVCQAILIVADWWLSYWTTQEEKIGKKANRERDLGIYGALVGSLVILGITRAILFFFVSLKSSKNLHGRMVRSALRAPVRFYDTNSIGRILNRFSKDMSLVDDMFTFVLFDFTQTALIVSGIVLLVCASNPVVFAFAAPIVIVFFFLRHYYIKTAREVKRIEGLNRSPVFGHLSTTLLGLPVIRAFQVQRKFNDFYNQYQDEHTKAWVTFLGCASWLAFRLELLSISFTAFVVFVSIALRDKVGLTSGEIGLMLSYTINLVGVFQQCVRQSAEVENNMTSVERVLEYTELDSEAPSETDVKPPDGWPNRGSIRFNNMTFAYAAGLPNVLRGVTAHVKSNEKVGICGRTGAGKSSLLTTLFRTSEPNGEISIDGVNVLELGLKDLRSKISIIPQDPVLFSGTMRRNLDPFSYYSDLELWNALEEVQLKEAVEALPGKLSSEMAESGQNLSVGQRQLVCLARAILKRNKILVIDEATANVDPITDALIQTTIREKFKDCTVLTIAHRLNTIMDSDRIMVLDAGKVKEFEEPYNLLRRRHTVLYQLVKQTGHAEAQNLFDMARKSYDAKHSEIIAENDDNKAKDDENKSTDATEDENKEKEDENKQFKSIQSDGIQFNISIEVSNDSNSPVVEETGESTPKGNTDYDNVNTAL